MDKIENDYLKEIHRQSIRLRNMALVQVICMAVIFVCMLTRSI